MKITAVRGRFTTTMTLHAYPSFTSEILLYSQEKPYQCMSSIYINQPVAICSDLRNFDEDPEQALRRPNQEELTVLGTTVDIMGFREQEQSEGYHHGPVFIVRFLGRQRFKLLECYRKLNGMMEAKVKILPEQLLPPKPLHLFTCPAHLMSSANQSLALLRSCENELQTLPAERLKHLQRNLSLVNATMPVCQASLWSFNQIDFHRLREQVKKEQQFKTFAGKENSAKLPEDVVSLSYWLSRQLPAETSCKLELLSINCPTRRILRALQILQSYTDLCCQVCGRTIAKKDAIFSMSVEGPLALYVNPGGYVHDTLTVMDASHLRTMGRSSTEHSWFPGYAWTIVNCRRCGDHKGWLFEATKRGLKPHKFYGLRRPSLHFTQGT
ncbi:protein cereblon-like isoform X2 [Dysidea avara]|uniref:protein cereblon-like isoform X2 n=1 Tax=Dysidea avara TaxID=196820 RepID=UPI0033220159